MTFGSERGRPRRPAPDLLRDLVALQYKRNDIGTSRAAPSGVRGDIVEIFPAHYEDRAWRLSLFGDEIEAIAEFDPLTGEQDRRAASRCRSMPTRTTSRRSPTLQQAAHAHQGSS